MQVRMKLNGGRWGGRREKAGRKRIRSRGVAHARREKVSARTPLHVNFRYRTRVRNKETLKLLRKSISNARKHGLRILHYSFQSNHIHLIVEADGNRILTKGMRSLTISLAKGLKMGRIQIERYHLHVLKTLAETRHAIHYVLFNQQNHERGTYSVIDNYSTLLCLPQALKLIRKFASQKRMTLKVDRLGGWSMDRPESFLFKRALESWSNEKKTLRSLR